MDYIDDNTKCTEFEVEIFIRLFTILILDELIATSFLESSSNEIY